MRTAARIGLAVLVTGSWAVAAPALKGKPGDSIVGEWVVETEARDGEAAVADNDMRWAFTADGLWLIYRGGEFDSEGRFAADRTASPASLDLKRGETADGRNLCIYRLEGDTLTVSFGWPHATRPAAFDSLKGTHYTVYVLKPARKQ